MLIAQDEGGGEIARAYTLNDLFDKLRSTVPELEGKLMEAEAGEIHITIYYSKED